MVKFHLYFPSAIFVHPLTHVFIHKVSIRYIGGTVKILGVWQGIRQSPHSQGAYILGDRDKQ